MQLRSPAVEADLRENVLNALRALASYYEATRLVQPKRLVRKCESLLDFIKIQGGARR